MMATLFAILVAVLTLMAACINGCNTLIGIHQNIPRPPAARCKEHPLRPKLCTGPKPAPIPVPNIWDDLIGQQPPTADGGVPPFPMAQMAPPPDVHVEDGYKLIESDGDRRMNHGAAW